MCSYSLMDGFISICFGRMLGSSWRWLIRNGNHNRNFRILRIFTCNCGFLL